MMSFTLKKQLLDVFKFVDNLEIELIKDDYCAKIYLKENSLF